MIQVKHFSKSYEQSLAVDDLSFEVAAGEVLGLVGRNGAGKTTTLRSINGIIPMTRGSIRVAGYDLERQPLEVKRRTAYVPDDPQLFEDLSVEQHLQFQASVYEIRRPENRVTELLQQFELDRKRHEPARSLSRGMRQKLAICSAYLQQPSALLLDEPMTGLDPQAIRMLKHTIEAESKRGTAIIISSHLLAMVEDICSHVMVLDHGQKRFQGTIEELQEHVDADNGDPSTPRSLEDAFFSTLAQQPPGIDPDVAPHGQAGLTTTDSTPANS